MWIPDTFVGPTVAAPTWSKHHLSARTVRELVAELFDRFPRLRLKYPESADQTEIKWFGLWRDEDDFDLRYKPGTMLGEDDVVHFVNLLGCELR